MHGFRKWLKESTVAFIVTMTLLACGLIMLLVTLQGCDDNTAKLWQKAKPALTQWAVESLLVARNDPSVASAYREEGTVAALERGAEVMLVEMQARATKEGSKMAPGMAEMAAYKLIQNKWPMIADMIARPGNQGLYWQLDRWLQEHGHPSLAISGLIEINISQAELDELFDAALPAIEQQYLIVKAGGESISQVESEEGIEIGDQS